MDFVEDGAEALDYFFKRGDYSKAPAPHLILLDLNLPKREGKEVLVELRSNSSTRDIPVFVLTTSRSEDERAECLSLGAQQFISKPSTLGEMEQVFQSIESWFYGKGPYIGGQSLSPHSLF